MSHREVRSYYDSFGEREWGRLERAADGAFELRVTCETLERYLPGRSRVLDLGGGPGRYAIWLAGRGHRVVLADLSPALLEIARRKIAEAAVGASVEEIVEVNATDLSRWDDQSFDAALCLGPFYHLTQPSDRIRAAQELYRVLKPGGLAFIPLMPRYSFLRRTLALPDERHHLADPVFVERVLEEGVFTNDVPGRFTGGYGFTVEEIEPFFESHGLETLSLLSTEGIVPDMQAELAELAESDPESHEAVVRVILHTASDRSILGISNHLLYVGRRNTES